MVVYLVTGLPYVGKSTAIDATYVILQESPKYILPALITTRPAPTAHAKREKCVTEDEFKKACDDGSVIHSWKDLNGSHGIPKAAVDAAIEGKKVVLEVPKAAVVDVEKKLGDIFAKMPEPLLNAVRILRLSAAPDTIAVRQKAKLGKEEKKDPKAAKPKADAEPTGANVVDVSVEKAPEELAAVLLPALDFDAAADIPPIDPDDLRRCSAQDYLKRTVYQVLAAGLTALDLERPSDPLSYLSLYMLQHESTMARQKLQISHLKSIQQELRRQAREDYQVQGRI